MTKWNFLSFATFIILFTSMENKLSTCHLVEGKRGKESRIIHARQERIHIHQAGKHLQINSIFLYLEILNSPQVVHDHHTKKTQGVKSMLYYSVNILTTCNSCNPVDPLLNHRTTEQLNFNMVVHGIIHKCSNSSDSFRGLSGPTFLIL